MNRITITGRLTRDPEQRAVPPATPSASFASPSTTWPRPANGLPGRHQLRQGRRSGGSRAQHRLASRVDGRLEHRTWQDNNGNSRQAYQVVGNVEFLAAPRAKDTTDEQPDSAGQETASEQA